MSVVKRDHACPDVTGDLRDALNARHGEAFARQLAVSAFLVDGVRWPGEGLPLVGLVRVDVLPPFAGG